MAWESNPLCGGIEKNKILSMLSSVIDDGTQERQELFDRYLFLILEWFMLEIDCRRTKSAPA